MLTQKRLKELLHYDPETGTFTWKVRTSNRVRVGDIAGSRHSTNGGKYVAKKVRVDGVTYLAHRLAWFYMYGIWPSGDTDHMDRNPLNNSAHNLRCATRKQNVENASMRADNTSGFRGVCFIPKTGRWFAQIRHNRVQVNIGYFDTPEEASAAYEAMRDKLFTHHQKKAA